MGKTQQAAVYRAYIEKMKKKTKRMQEFTDYMYEKAPETEHAMKTYKAGRGTFTASIDMNYDETSSQQTSLTQGSSLSFVFLPEGNDSGDESFSGTGIVTGMSVGVTLDGMTTRTVALQGNGALTTGNV